MPRLTARFPDFFDVFDKNRMRAFVRHLEQLFAQITVDKTVGAYTATGDFTIAPDDDVVLVDTSSGNVTVTLPAISLSMVREKYEVEVIKSKEANALMVVPSGSDTVLGETGIQAEVQWTAMRFRATTGNWVLV